MIGHLNEQSLLLIWIAWLDGQMVITARKRSCGKVMFLRLSVILFTGEGMYPNMQWAGGVHPSMQRGVCLWVKRGCTPYGQTPTRVDTPWTYPPADTHPGRHPLDIPLGRHPLGRHPQDGHWSCWYTSYLNALLSIIASSEPWTWLTCTIYRNC